MNLLHDILIQKFGSEAEIARAFQVKRAQHFAKRVPEHVALLCHLDPTIPYTYDPAHYGRDTSNLALSLAKPKHNHNNKQAA